MHASAGSGESLTPGHFYPIMISCGVRSLNAESRSSRRRKGSRAGSSPTGAKVVTGGLYLGSEFTTLKDRKKEVGKGLLAKMCRDLKIRPEEL